MIDDISYPRYQSSFRYFCSVGGIGDQAGYSEAEGGDSRDLSGGFGSSVSRLWHGLSQVRPSSSEVASHVDLRLSDACGGELCLGTVFGSQDQDGFGTLGGCARTLYDGVWSTHDWLQDAISSSTVASRMGVSWTMIAHIMARAVNRGLARRADKPVARICVDEISAKKGHKYITVVSNPTTGTVLYVGEGRTISSSEGYYRACSSARLDALESVSMDMWPAYITETKAWVSGADQKIAFDRFHIAKSIGTAVDDVRKQENRELRNDDREDLVGTKYDWLINRANMSTRQKRRFQQLKTSSLKTVRAWAIKELSRNLWHSKGRTWHSSAGNNG